MGLFDKLKQAFTKKETKETNKDVVAYDKGLEKTKKELQELIIETDINIIKDRLEKICKNC